MKNKGITLISLVVTIIILIILAGVSINLTLGENGIITMAIRAKKEQDIVRIKEELEIEKYELAIKENGILDLNKYLEQLINNGKITESDIDRNSEESVNILVEGKYVFLVEKEEPNNIKIEYIGEPGNLIPKIKVENANIWTKSKKVTITEVSGYTIKYTLDGTTPSESNGITYSGAFTINDNNTTITAVYLDSQNKMGAISTNTITKIDTTGPIINLTIDTITSNSISVTADALDTQSGVEKDAIYEFYIKKTSEDDSKYILKQSGISKICNFTDLLYNTKYTILVKTNDIIGNIGTITNVQDTKILTISELSSGVYIKYDTGISGTGVITCRLLYEESSLYGAQIISNKSVKKVTLGNTDFDLARTSYNNAIKTLNAEAEAYINNSYATDARCVGSDPLNKNAETTTMETLQFTPNGWSNRNSGCKGTDKNYKTDWEKMNNLNISSIGEHYWLASRYVNSNTTGCAFNILNVDSNGKSYYNGGICSIFSSTHGYQFEYGLRVCFKLKSNLKIISGDGKSESTAYVLGI